MDVINLENTTDIVSNTIRCLKCSNAMPSYLNSNAYSIICSKCGQVHNTFNGVLQLTNETVAIAEKTFCVPISAKGNIKGIPYTVIAHAYKREQGTNYYWQEYSLFNPIHGQAYLSQYDGHWMYLVELADLPTYGSSKRKAVYQGVVYDLFSDYKAKLVSARGEWLYQFSSTEMPIVEEFVIHGQMISKEQTADNITWYKGEYIEPKTIKEAFKLETIPATKGVGMIQPFMGKFKIESLRRISVILVVLWAIAQLFFMSAAKEEVAFSQSFTITDSINKKEIYSNPFELKYGTANVEIKVNTDIDNNWMYTGITLVNEKTGDLYDVDLEAEYYHGYEGGESWSEGNNWVSKVVSQVPEGTYYMIIYPDKPVNLASVNIDISARRDVYIFSNGLILLIVLGIFPAFYFYRERNFEKKRWYNSNYSPYQYDEDN